MAIRYRANIKSKEVRLPMGIQDPKTGEVSKIVRVTAMDGNAEERVSEKKLRNNGAKIITALLADKIVGIGKTDYPKGIGVVAARQMWSADRDTCLKEIRSLMADDMTVNPKCTECGEQDEDVIYMSQIEVGDWDPNNMPEGIVASDVGVFEFELPDGLILCDDETSEELLCKRGRIRLTNGAIEESIAQAARENLGAANTTLLAASIVELENVKMVDSYVVKAMSKADRDYLSKIISDGNPGPKFIREHICSNCGAKVKYLLRLPDFFTNGKNR